MYSQTLYSTLFFLASLLFLVLIYQQYFYYKTEAFTQKERFVLKENEDIYDEFYIEVYDDLTLSDDRAKMEVEQMIDMTMPSKDMTVILDVGCGTGDVVAQMAEKGYEVYGCDRSYEMIEKCRNKYPGKKYEHGDATVTMLYDRNMFSHILCTYYTIYEMKDKTLFFKNCYYWMKPGGYLILHLVDRDNFSPIVPAGLPYAVDNINDLKQHANKRLKNTRIDFGDYIYESVYKFEFIERDSTVVHIEKFEDKLNGNIRENEQTLYMENTKDILKMVIRSGFLVVGKAIIKSGYGDQHQYLYVLERTL
jgi:ubiquinone/menaquinone biosynthesis C-methylase UbiE